MSIQNYTQQVLTLANFMELPKSMNFPIMTTLINFQLDYLHPILGLHLIIYLNILQNYYPRSAYQRTKLKIPKKLLKNSKTFLWIVIQRQFIWACPLSFPLYYQISPHLYVTLQHLYREKESVRSITPNESKELHKKCSFFF